MSGKRYNESFKIEAVKQVTECGHSVSDVANRLGITTKSLYGWKEKYGKGLEAYEKTRAAQDEIRALRSELKRVTQERDILKEAAVGSTGHRNTLFHHLFRAHEFQCFSGSLV